VRERRVYFSAGHIGVLSPTDATAMGSLGVL
jgi:hypothetical protein